MKLHFEPDLDYQLQAIESVCDLFRGQEISRSEFTVTARPPAAGIENASNGTSIHQMTLGIAESDLGVGNRLTLLDDEIFQNLTSVQLRNGLAPSSTLTSGDFTVEMETGTGKTYVYLRTIYELNKRYGFTKFVIVVPSVAIKEGVYKTLQITEEHFRTLYGGVPSQYFQYDSSKLGRVRNFATSASIEIMVVTVGAINKKDVNNLYKATEKTNDELPIDLVKACRPVVIVDEPQSVDGGLNGAGKAALEKMNPLCTLRYSATHANAHHMVYRLDAVDAYERKLVKQIEVASATVANANNKPYVKLIDATSKRGSVSAKIEIDEDFGNGVRRRVVKIVGGEDLELMSGRAIYADHRIIEIGTSKGNEFVALSFPGGEAYLRIGESHGDVDSLAIKRQMIQRTIREHFEKERRLRPRGIKVLSLFFIDRVEKYRSYDADGKAVKGEYARIFEEEYKRAAANPEFSSLFGEIDLALESEQVHGGYFSIDKKGGWSDTGESDALGRDNAERAYNLIMKDKERLLSLETPLKFIFSHSALREGWDNPNVFQICALREMGSERERRQTIGRGLRLCVNQDGERVRGFDTNTLTVVATEKYEEFAEGLQKEIEDATGIRFAIVERHQFAAISVQLPDGGVSPLGAEQSAILWDYCSNVGYIDQQGRVQECLKLALKDDALVVPPEFIAHKGKIAEVLIKLAGRLVIKNADERRPVRTREAVLHGTEFKALWDRVNRKTTYRVQFDNEKLIVDSAKRLHDAQTIPRAQILWRKADIAIGKAGVTATQIAGNVAIVVSENDIPLPDLITDLQDRTQLTRRTIIQILIRSGRLVDFKNNPQLFIELAAEAIIYEKSQTLVSGIKYQRLGDSEYYAQQLFDQEELTGYVKNLLENAQKSIYQDVVCDSDTEKAFASDLELNTEVKVYAKLPGWFKVPTPVGSYNPDWALIIERDGQEQLYFVVETKGGLFAGGFRPTEKAKIDCGRAHFAALSVSELKADYVVANTLNDVFNYVP